MGNKKQVDRIFSYMPKSRQLEIEQFVEEIEKRDYKEFSTDSEIADSFLEYMTDFYQNTRVEEREAIRNYSGISFREINSILRHTWDYDYNGSLTDEKRETAYFLAEKLSKTIERQEPLSQNIKAYRGVPASIFQDEKIESIEDLVGLKGTYYYESGFTSTSLIRERSFFDRPLEFHENCNVEIEYFIPKESKDCIPLITNHLSYSPAQTELLLNKGSLSKIVDISINKEENKAYMKAAFIPKSIWDPIITKVNEETGKKRAV